MFLDVSITMAQPGAYLPHLLCQRFPSNGPPPTMSDLHDLDSDSAVYKTLLESTQAIPWKIDWASMTFAYIGPQIEPLLGWTRES